MLQNLLRDQRGFTLIEGVVAGVLLLSAMTATYGLIGTSSRAEEDQRNRTASYSLAQDDQTRLRSLRISQLMTLNETRTVTQDGTPFTITSTGQFVTDSSGTASCDEGVAAADYIKITSSVNWGGGNGHKPTKIESVVAPPNGTFGVDSGTLAVAVRDSAGNPVAGVPLGLTGQPSQTTGSNGCALFANVPEGNYTLTPSTTTGVVDKDGIAPGPQTVSVVAQSTNTVALQYDNPGTVKVDFKTRVGGVIKSGTMADSIVVFNSGMTKEAVFGTVGNEVLNITSGPLFPFTSADTIYAGTCTANNPNPTNLVNPPAAAARALVTITKNTQQIASIQLPALQVTVRSGTSSSNPGSIVSNAAVTLTDTVCQTSTGAQVKRTYTNRTTGSPTGLVPTGQTEVDPGVPYGVYNVCAYNGSRRNTTNNVPIQTTATDTSITIYVGSGATGSATGACP